MLGVIPHVGEKLRRTTPDQFAFFSRHCHQRFVSSSLMCFCSFLPPCETNDSGGGWGGRVQNLISHGADVEARNAVERTPLISAASAGNVDVLRILLDHGE